MSAEQGAPPLPLEEQPLATQIELQEVRLIELSARVADEPTDLPRVTVDLDEFAYQVDGETILVRHLTKVAFFRSATASHDADSPDPEGDEVPDATLRFVHLMKLQLAGDPEYVTEERFRELASGTLLFMLFPYIRSATQRFAAEVSLPSVVLPILRRPIRGLEGRSN